MYKMIKSNDHYSLILALGTKKTFKLSIQKFKKTP